MSRRHEGWVQKPCFLKMEPLDFGQLGTQAAFYKFGIHEIGGICAGLGTSKEFWKKDLQDRTDFVGHFQIKMLLYPTGEF